MESSIPAHRSEVGNGTCSHIVCDWCYAIPGTMMTEWYRVRRNAMDTTFDKAKTEHLD